jgi:hypothetical protein
MSHYQGHLNDGSSIQKHSAGGIYPCIVYAQGTPDGLKYGLITPRDQVGTIYGTYDYSVALALYLKDCYKW